MEQRIASGIGYIAGAWPLDPKKSTLVFIHGAGGTGDFWSAQVRSIVERVNTVAIDLPGHGRSEGSGHDRVEDYARVLIDFISAIEAPKPIPCGISLGGAITQQLLLDYPERFKAGILINTGSRLRVAPEIFQAIEKDLNGYVDMMAKFAVSNATDPDRVKRFRDDTARCKPEVLVKDFQACDRFDVMERLEAITSPVLVVTAEDDQVTPPKYGDFMEKSIAKASRIHIQQAGHIATMEKPDEVNKAIVEFLDGAGL